MSVYEKEELEAQKEYYANIKQEMGKERKRKLKFLEKLSIFHAIYERAMEEPTDGPTHWQTDELTDQRTDDSTNLPTDEFTGV